MRLKLLAAFLAVVAIVGFTGAMSAQADDDARSDADAMVAEAVRMDQMFVELFNDRKFDELGARYYAEDAILGAPNTEPIRGRAAIVKYLRGARDGFGEIEMSGPPLRSAASGALVSVVGQFSFHHGQVRTVNHELFERQPDGTLRAVHDTVNFRDPLR